MTKTDMIAVRLYEKRRKLGTVLLLGAFGLFVAASIIFKDLNAPFGWAIWVTFGLFAVSCVTFLVLTRCPFCGRTIVVGAIRRQNCPHCHKSLVEKKPEDKRVDALARRRDP